MSPGEGSPEFPSVVEEWTEELENRSTRDRVYAVALQLYEPTNVATVATRADVSKETARAYLKWFVELGTLKQDADSPALFSRNESYFQWRRIQHLRSLPTEELEAEQRELVERERSFRDRYGADDPAAVDAFEHADYDELDDVWMDLKQWNTVRRRLHEIERARRDDDRPAETPA